MEQQASQVNEVASEKTPVQAGKRAWVAPSAIETDIRATATGFMPAGPDMGVYS